MIHSRATALFLSAVLCACGRVGGEQTTQPLCEPSGEPSGELALVAHQFADLSATPQGQHVLLDNGGMFLAVDTHCHFWAFDGSTQADGRWADPVSGSLGADGAEALASALDLANWPDHDGTSEKQDNLSHGPTYAFASGAHSFSVNCLDCADLSDAGRIAAELPGVIGAHVGMGERTTPRRVRYYAISEGEGFATNPNIPYHPTPDGLLPGSVNFGEDYCFGDSGVIDDEEAIAWLRGVRDRHLDGEFGQWWYGYVPVELPSGERFQVFFRDELPIEDPRGLIEFGSVSRSESCARAEGL